MRLRFALNGTARQKRTCCIVISAESQLAPQFKEPPRKAAAATTGCPTLQHRHCQPYAAGHFCTTVILAGCGKGFHRLKPVPPVKYNKSDETSVFCSAHCPHGPGGAKSARAGVPDPRGLRENYAYQPCHS